MKISYLWVLFAWDTEDTRVLMNLDNTANKVHGKADPHLMRINSLDLSFIFSF